MGLRMYAMLTDAERWAKSGWGRHMTLQGLERMQEWKQFAARVSPF